MFARYSAALWRPLAAARPGLLQATRGIRRLKNKEHYAGLKSSLLNHLDLDRESKKNEEGKSNIPKGKRQKIDEPLDTPDAPFVDSIAHGIMETNGHNICEILNEAIEKSKASQRLAELGTSMGLMIEEVVETVHRGKVTALWAAPELDKFLEFAAQKDEKASRKMKKLFANNITELLQKAEPQFRAYLIKKMDFKKVPLIKFQQFVEEGKDLASNEARQAFLREQARSNYSVLNTPDDVTDFEMKEHHAGR